MKYFIMDSLKMTYYDYPAKPEIMQKIRVHH